MTDLESEGQRDGVRQNERDGEIRLVVSITNKNKYFNNEKNTEIGRAAEHTERLTKNQR